MANRRTQKRKFQTPDEPSEFEFAVSQDSVPSPNTQAEQQRQYARHPHSQRISLLIFFFSVFLSGFRRPLQVSWWLSDFFLFIALKWLHRNAEEGKSRKRKENWKGKEIFENNWKVSQSWCTPFAYIQLYSSSLTVGLLFYKLTKATNVIEETVAAVWVVVVAYVRIVF